uniref:Uncharacterized protein n=1 Tax=Strigamia maritima TaxID=126957 RepID=T1IK62_STRMM
MDMSDVDNDDVLVNAEDNSGQNVHLKYSFTPATLQQIASVTILTQLWSHKQRLSVDETRLNKEWKEIENLVLNSLSKLPFLHKQTRDSCLKIVTPIAKNQILIWINWQKKENVLSEPNCTNDDLVWTSEGKINRKETRHKLLSKDWHQYCIDEKHELACTFCLVDYTDTVTPTIFSLGFLESVDINIEPIKYFWTFDLTKDKKFEKIIRTCHRWSPSNETILEYVLNSVRNDQTDDDASSVKYSWNELSDENKKRNIIRAARELRDADNVCSLLSKMNEKQWRELFYGQENFHRTLSPLLSSCLWQDYFITTIQHVWNNIRKSDYLAMLKEIAEAIFRATDKDIYRAVLTELWENAPDLLKQFVFENPNNFSNLILSKLFYRETMDLVQLMLSYADCKQKKQVAYSSCAIDQCRYLIQINEWDVFDAFIKCTLLCEEDVEQFKRMFVREKGTDVCNLLILRNEWDKVGIFLGRCFKSGDEMSKFKQKLAYDNLKKFNQKEACIDDTNIFIVLLEKAVFDFIHLYYSEKYYFEDDYTGPDFSKLDANLKWFFQNDNQINEFKVKMFENTLSFCFLQLISNLIRRSEWGVLNDTLDWCFLKDPVKIRKFKMDFMSRPEYEMHIVTLIADFIRVNDKLKSFKQFVDWCFANVEEVNRYKKEVLRFGNVSVQICALLLGENEGKLVNEFVNWFCLSKKGVDEFKKKLLKIDFDGSHILPEYKSLDLFGVKTIINFVNWCAESVVKFKEKICTGAG